MESGGHIYGSGLPGKTVFPEAWDPDLIISTMVDVGRNPDEPPQPQDHGMWQVRGTREGVLTQVVLTMSGELILGHPLAGPGVHRNDADGRPCPLENWSESNWVGQGGDERNRRIVAHHLAIEAMTEGFAGRFDEGVLGTLRSFVLAGDLTFVLDRIIGILVRDQVQATSAERDALATAIGYAPRPSQYFPYVVAESLDSLAVSS